MLIAQIFFGALKICAPGSHSLRMHPALLPVEVAPSDLPLAERGGIRGGIRGEKRRVIFPGVAYKAAQT
jgi:hypothetical protein